MEIDNHGAPQWAWKDDRMEPSRIESALASARWALRCFLFPCQGNRLMASFTQSRIGRRDAMKISARILMGIVRVLDFALLLIAAWLAAIGVGAWLQAPLRGLLGLTATIGAGTGCIVLASQGAYALD